MPASIFEADGHPLILTLQIFLPDCEDAGPSISDDLALVVALGSVAQVKLGLHTAMCLLFDLFYHRLPCKQFQKKLS